MAKTSEDKDAPHRIAERARAALRERLQSAFEEAAAAHAEVLALDAQAMDRMVQHTVDRADGLQWRRALAVAATQELGIGLGEALGHPAVVRAQKLVGAPSYEEGLAAIAEGKPPPPGSGGPGGAESTDEPLQAKASASSRPKSPPRAEEGDGDGFPVRVDVVHRGGLPKLEGEGELELHLSAKGLKVIRASDRVALVRFVWDDLDAVSVQPRRGRVLRRRGAQVIVSAKGREARFDASDVDPEELERRLASAIAQLAPNGTDA